MADEQDAPAPTAADEGAARAEGPSPAARPATPSPFFSAHARAYAESASHARGADLEALLRALRPQRGQRAADVGTGTGHTALALAAAGLDVVGVDPTPAMLAEAARLAAARGLAGRVRWVVGAAEALPLDDGALDVVTCRRAAHHFADVGRAVREMARVLRPGGRLGLTDACPDGASAEAMNRLERLRDATHARALTEEEWREVLAAAGLAVRHWSLMEEVVTFADWLSPVPAAGPEAQAAAAELQRLPEAVRWALTGGRPGGWLKRRVVFVAARA